MIVCHCHAVNDLRIRAEIERGARDEVAISQACGAGAGCGGCLPALSRLLDECLTCPLRRSEPAARGPVVAVG